MLCLINHNTTKTMFKKQFFLNWVQQNIYSDKIKKCIHLIEISIYFRYCDWSCHRAWWRTKKEEVNLIRRRRMFFGVFWNLIRVEKFGKQSRRVKTIQHSCTNVLRNSVHFLEIAEFRCSAQKFGAKGTLHLIEMLV